MKSPLNTKTPKHQNTKNFKAIFSLCLWSMLTLTNYLHAQDSTWKENLTKADTNYHQLKKKFNEYYRQKTSFSENENKEAKHFKRAQFFWDSRVDENGSLDTWYNEINKGQGKEGSRTSKMCNNPNVNWESLGPYHVTQNASPDYFFDGIGAVYVVEVHPSNPDIIYIGTNSAGIFKTTDGGNSWNNVTDVEAKPGMGITSIAISPHNPQIIYASTYVGAAGPSNMHYGIGIIYSFDGGQTWKEVTSLPGHNNNSSNGYNKQIEKIRFSQFSPNIVVAAIQNDLWYCTNANSQNPTGTIYNDPLTSEGYQFPNAPNTFPNIINDLEVANGSIYATFRSTASNQTAVFKFQVGNPIGQRWTDLTPTDAYTSFAAEIDFVPGTTIGSEYILAYTTSNTLKVKWYKNYGASPQNPFKSKSYSIQGGYGSTNFARTNFRLYLGLECSPTEVGKLYVPGNHLNVIEWNNQTNEWADQSDIYFFQKTHVDVRDVHVIPDPNDPTADIVFSGNDGGIAKSFTSNTNKNNPPEFSYIHGNGGLNITQIYSFDVAPNDINKLTFGAQDNGTQTENGYFNFFRSGGGDGGETMFNPFDPSKIVYVSNSGAAGTAWIENYTKGLWGGSVVGYVANSSSPLAMRKKNGLEGMLSADHEVHLKNDIYSSILPTAISYVNQNPANEHITALATTIANPNLIVMGFGNSFGNNNSNLWKTTNDGATWTDISNAKIKDAYPQFCVISPTDDQKMWLGCSNFKLKFNTNIVINKVFYTTDGGTTWLDISNNLPNLPVNTMVYEDGTNDRVYIGTDLGVYYAEQPYDSTTQWQCLNNNLPPVIISRLRVQKCEGKLYASTYGRGMYKTNLVNAASNYGQNVIASNATWSGVRESMDDIIIEPNTTLTLNSCELKMAKGRKILVKVGAQLVVNSSKVTSLCSCPWQGIRVLGDNSSPQIPHTNQGKVVITNESIIEHADIGVKVGNTNQGGGILHANSNSKFLNNTTGIAFYDYSGFIPGSPGSMLYNQSRIEDCTFEWDDNYYNLHDKPVQPFAANLKGIYIKNCDIRNILANRFVNSTSLEVAGHGVHASESNLVLVGRCQGNVMPCSNYDKNIFENLETAVLSSSTNASKTARIENTEIKTCVKGITIQATENVVITNNSIKMNPGYGYYSPYGWQVHEGIKLESATGYTIQNNVIEGTCFESGGTVINPCAYTVGINVENSGPFPNEIYRNEIKGMEMGVRVIGLNAFIDPNIQLPEFWGAPGYGGLQIRCERFVNNQYDVFLDDAKIAQYQGKPFGNTTEMAGNLFSNFDMTCGTPHHHYFNNNLSLPLNTFNISQGGGMWQSIDVWYSYIHHTESAKAIINHDFPSEPYCYDQSSVNSNNMQWLTTTTGGHINTGFQNTCPNYLVGGTILPGSENMLAYDNPSAVLDYTSMQYEELANEFYGNTESEINRELDNFLNANSEDAFYFLQGLKTPLTNAQIAQLIVNASPSNLQRVKALVKLNEPLSNSLKENLNVEWIKNYRFSDLSKFDVYSANYEFEKLKLGRNTSLTANYWLTQDSAITAAQKERISQLLKLDGTAHSNRGAKALKAKDQNFSFDSFENIRKKYANTTADSSVLDACKKEFYQFQYDFGYLGAYYAKHTQNNLISDRLSSLQSSNSEGNSISSQANILHQETRNQAINVFPNPSKDQLFFNFAGEKDESCVNVYIDDLQGRRLINLNCMYPVANNNYEVNTSFLATGTYILNVELNGKIYVQQFIAK